MNPQLDSSNLFRRRWRVQGQVQGVGFRPCMYRIAQRLGVTGFVRNDSDGVTIEAQGQPWQLLAFDRALRTQLPQAADVRSQHSVECAVAEQETGFVIQQSQDVGPLLQISIPPDSALCEPCRCELFCSTDRRHLHALINCTQCGPRYSIARRLPYDRANTTMDRFAMCELCDREFRQPTDRRFHAQPICCPDCGPRIQLVTPRGDVIAGDVIPQAAALLWSGKIVAVKGIGGFHLAVRADVESFVLRLRELKHRDEKPFALMCRDLAAAERLVVLGDGGCQALRSAAAPIVLAPRREPSPIAAAVAPGMSRLGVMLAYTPLHALLFAELPQEATLVMTSANVSDEPLAVDNREALERIADLCDALLWHDRPIQRSVEDSVLMDDGDPRGPAPIRRSRGFAPRPLPLPMEPPAAWAYGLCVGGDLKNTACAVRGDAAVLSQHLGDLMHPVAWRHFQAAIADLLHFTEVEPQWIASDLHPQYQSTRYALKWADERGLPVLAIQHHHAHAAAAAAENGCLDPFLAVVCDGAGLGDDGGAWGGELLSATFTSSVRLGRLRPMWLVGGDAAARDARRSALALLEHAYDDPGSRHEAARRHLDLSENEQRMLTTCLERRVQCTESSSAGRLFDGVAALLGIRQFNTFEGQAPMLLEAAAAEVADDPRREAALVEEGELEWPAIESRLDSDIPGLRRIDMGPLIAALLLEHRSERALAELAFIFHDRLAAAWSAVVYDASQQTGFTQVALSGGCFCNALLTRRLCERLEGNGLEPLRHRRTPPNDGGLAYGQAVVATARLQLPEQEWRTTTWPRPDLSGDMDSREQDACA